MDEGAGQAAEKSSMRVYCSRTGRSLATAQAATSGSISPNLPPNPPPTGIGTTLTCETVLPSAAATVSRVRTVNHTLRPQHSFDNYIVKVIDSV
jgi:hypothetical protein